jgi:hypothetical protein
MAETMWDNKVTINPNTNQYHLVVFLVTGCVNKTSSFKPMPFGAALL